jgi:hypothetical protein
MTTEKDYPDLLIPPFWGNSEMLNFDAGGASFRGMYAFFTLFREEKALVIMDALEPGRQIAEIEISKKNRPFLERFRPESDVVAVAAAAMEEGDGEFPRDAAGEFLGREIRRGLNVDDRRGEMIPLSQYPVISPEDLTALEREMTFKDRLGIVLPEDASRTEVFLFVHNSRNDRRESPME